MTTIESLKSNIGSWVKETYEKLPISSLLRGDMTEYLKKMEGVQEAKMKDPFSVLDFWSAGTTAPIKQIEKNIAPKITSGIKSTIGQDISEAIRWLNNSIKTAAKPKREALEKIYKAERSRRAGALAGIFESGEGKSGYIKALGQLKGELAPVKKKLFDIGTQPEDMVNILYRAAQLNSKLNTFEKFNTQTILGKVLDGKIPTNRELLLLEKTYGQDLTKSILSRRDLGQKVLSGLEQVINLPRTIMASFDLSAPFRQGLLLMSHPKRFFGAFNDMFKAFGSERAFRGIQESIEKMPDYELMKASKLSLTDIGSFLTEREEKYMASWGEKIPLIGRGIKASSRAYTGFLNKIRAEVFSDIVRGAKIAGKDVSINSNLSKEIANFVNAASGRGRLELNVLGKKLSAERAATTLNGLFFSPRLLASRLHFLNPYNYVAASPIVRKEMLKSVLTLTGAGMTVLGFAKQAGLEVGDDWRSADFGKIKIGKTRVDIWGGFQQYARMFGQLYTGEYVSSVTGKKMTLGEGYKPLSRYDILQRQIESKEAPIMSFITSILKQQDYQGQPVEVKKEIVNRLTPMVIGDMIDLAKEDPSLLPIQLLGFFGFGLQTYQPYKGGAAGRKSSGPLQANPLKSSGGLKGLKGLGL